MAARKKSESLASGGECEAHLEGIRKVTNCRASLKPAAGKQ